MLHQILKNLCIEIYIIKYMDKVSLLISNFGIEKYKDFVDNYNKDLELQKKMVVY